jgi:hypothetical protein
MKARVAFTMNGFPAHAASNNLPEVLPTPAQQIIPNT